MTSSALVFGARGQLGARVAEALEGQGVRVVRATRLAAADGWISTQAPGWAGALPPRSVDRVVWAQGQNAQGSILDDGPDQLRELFDANVHFIVDTLRALLDHDCLAAPTRTVLISSVWQVLARPNKLAYVTSKAAIGGLVRSLASDLGDHGICVNAILPGVVDSPMTRTFLPLESITEIANATPGRALVSADDIARACVWLTDPASSGINGQSITVDHGWSAIRHV